MNHLHAETLHNNLAVAQFDEALRVQVLHRLGGTTEGVSIRQAQALQVGAYDRLDCWRNLGGVLARRQVAPGDGKGGEGEQEQAGDVVGGE